MKKKATMTVKTSKTADKRKSRGICRFLLNLLEDESYPHVQWTNKEKGEFQIHWMHASSGAWDRDNDAETFRLWAEAKGKLEGREMKYKTWKANFRCAMKSRHELQEMKLPRGSPLRKKNLKFWKFVDTEFVNKYKDGENFDWRRPRTKSNMKKSVQVDTLRSRQNKKNVNKKENRASPRPHSDNYDDQRSTDVNVDSNFNSYGAGLLKIIDRDAEETDSMVPNMPLDERLHMDIEEDNNYNPYGAGLLGILEKNSEDKESVTSNTHFDDRNTAVLPYYRNLCHRANADIPLPILHPEHQMPLQFCPEQPFSELRILSNGWKVFGNLRLKNIFNEEGLTNNYDVSYKNLIVGDDPFLHGGIYAEL